MKKFLSRLLLAVIVLTASLGLCVPSYAYDEAEITFATQQYLESWNSTDFTSYMTEEVIASMDEETKALYTSWKELQAQLGAYSATSSTTVTDEGGIITAVISATYENGKMDFTIQYDQATAESYGAANAVMKIDAKATDQKASKPNMGKAAMNTIMGMGTVFVVLIFISAIISLLKYVPNLIASITGANKKVEKENLENLIEERPVAALLEEPVEDLKDDSELVAVIMAAIEVYEGKNIPADGLVVRSIRRR